MPQRSGDAAVFCKKLQRLFMLIIKDLRKQQKLSQQQVSEQLGITRVALSHYETGKREPNLRMLQKLSEFYNVSIDYIITGKDFIKSER